MYHDYVPPSTPWLGLLSFISGLTGLVYEVVWAKDLALTLGATARAQAVVLAAFLGGLAAGSLRLGPRADRARSPLLFYAKVEWTVALAGALSPALLRLVGSSTACALLAVAGPAVLMGAALPALCRAACGSDLQRTFGRIYGANCAGAVFGSLIAAFFLVPTAGLEGAVWIAAGLNALNGLAAWKLAPVGATGPALSSTKKRTATEPQQSFPAPLVYVLMFASGFVSLTFEGAWTRALALVMGASTYSFAVMLAGFIAGIALGGRLAGSKRMCGSSPGIGFAAAELCIALTALATPSLLPRLPYWFRLMSGRAPATMGGFYALEAGKLALAFLVMAPMTVAVGMTLPLAARLVGGAAGEEGATVGGVLAANTAGNVAGAAAVLWLLPALGLAGVLRSGSTVSLALGLAASWAAAQAPRSRKLATAAGCAALAAALRLVLPPADLMMLSLGDFRGRGLLIPSRYEVYRAAMKDGETLLYYKDGAESTVSVLRRDNGKLSLKVNGKTDASTGQDMLTQQLVGQLPLFLKPDARRVMVVGLGSGVTAGAVLRHPVERLDVAELSPEVVEAQRLFAAASGSPLADPRLSLHVEDARAFLRREPRRYDVIISEPSNPWVAGVANLFTREFDELARERLADGGVMVQWFHVYEMDDDDVRLVLRTFRSVFPHVTVWSVLANDIILVGSTRPLEPDFAAMERRLLLPGVWDDFTRAGFVYLSGLLSLQSQGERTAAELSGAGPLNLDRFPRLESAAPKAYFLSRSSTLITDRHDRLDPARREELYLARYLRARGRPLEASEYADIVLYPHMLLERDVVASWVLEWRKRFPRDRRALQAALAARDAQQL